MTKSEGREWLRQYALKRVPHGGTKNQLLRVADLIGGEEVGVAEVSAYLEERGITLIPWQKAKLWKGEL